MHKKWKSNHGCLTNGDLEIHYHGLYVDRDGKVSGGLFLREENLTAITIGYVIERKEEARVEVRS